MKIKHIVKRLVLFLVIDERGEENEKKQNFFLFWYNRKIYLFSLDFFMREKRT
jgi:hypothetical protein